ncbi:MAG: hypothetical protein HQ518_12665 [Rhodopirellula sp.]|nr:hypothetical protein [Rhodopirellula sp.]
MDSETVIRSDWLPRGELARLVTSLNTEFPSVTVREESSGPRGADPAIAVAIITSTAMLLAPFATELAKKLFSKEPDSTVLLVKEDGSVAVSVSGNEPEEKRKELFTEAVASGEKLSLMITRKSEADV